MIDRGKLLTAKGKPSLDAVGCGQPCATANALAGQCGFAAIARFSFRIIGLYLRKEDAPCC